MAASPLERVPVPPGSEGAARLLQALAEALTGSGPAIAPVPTVSATVSNDYVASILRALHIDAGLPLESPEVALTEPSTLEEPDPSGYWPCP